MPVSQNFIDLLRLPASVLKKLADDLDVAIAKGATHWQAAKALEHVSRSVLEEHAGSYLYAGSTSLSWFRLIPEEDDPSDDTSRFYPLYGSTIDREAAVDALRELSEADPFDEAQRPTNVTAKPELVCARWLDDEVLLLTFVVARRAGHVIHNFETQQVLQDDFFNAVFRLQPGVVEVRSSALRARSLLRNWIRPYAHILGMEPVEVALTERDSRELHDQLDAVLDDFKGKTATGTSAFDTAQYSKAEDIKDLVEEEEFREATRNLEPITENLLFSLDGLGEIRIYVSLQSHSIFVRTAASEEVLQHIYDAVERVKQGAVGVL